MNGVTLHGSFTSSQLHRTEGSASEPERKVSASDLTIVQISEERLLALFPCRTSSGLLLTPGCSAAQIPDQGALSTCQQTMAHPAHSML